MKMRNALENLRNLGYQSEGPVEDGNYQIYGPRGSQRGTAEKKAIATLFRDEQRNVRASIVSNLYEADPCLYQNLTKDLEQLNVYFV